MQVMVREMQLLLLALRGEVSVVISPSSVFHPKPISTYEGIKVERSCCIY